MKIETLKILMNIRKRHNLFYDLLNQFKKYQLMENINYNQFETEEGPIPVITITKTKDIDEVKYVKLFIGAQHNEYNGLFGILEFFNRLRNQVIDLNHISYENQILIFLPLMNPYGFLNPKKENKSGYYLRNGLNLNRFWRKVFVPNYVNEDKEIKESQIPEQAKIVENIIQKYWNNNQFNIYIMDFHETSLMLRYLEKLIENLHKDLSTYKFEHWLEEKIILNIIELHKIINSRKPFFYKSFSKQNHTHINLTIKEMELVHKKLKEYYIKNIDKLPFYFCYSSKSQNYCEELARNVYEKLREKLWETKFPAFDHKFHDYGCFVNMNENISREKVYCMELETHKQFFNIFEEIEKSEVDSCYFEKKLEIVNISIELVVETIKQMIFLF